MSTSPNGDDPILKIPKDSYTAFRLKYSDSLELYNSSTVIFIGNIPPAWILDKKSIILAKIYRLNDTDAKQKSKIQHRTLHHFENAMHVTDKFPNNNKSTDNINIEYAHHHHLRKKIFKNLLNNKQFENLPTNDFLTDSNLHSKKMIPEAHDNRSSFFSKIYQKPICEMFNKKANATRSKINNIHLDQKIIDSLHPTSDNSDDGNSETDESSSFSSEASSNMLHLKYLKSHTFDANINNKTPTSSDVGDYGENTLSTNNLTVTPKNVNDFMLKSNKEKQKIIKQDIESAMQALESNHSEYSAVKSKEKIESKASSSDESDDASFVTASEIPLGEPLLPDTDVNKQEIDTKVKQPKKSVTFESSNSSIKDKSLYSLKSNNILLDKQQPTPYSDQNILDDDILSKENINESYKNIDENLTKTYELLKSETLGAKIRPNYNKHEQKLITKRLLKNFHAGEIIKMEKMLVMVSTVEKVKIHKDKNTSRILERWKEYIIVIRVTKDPEYPAVIQFFKSNKIFRKDELDNLKEEIHTQADEDESINEDDEALSSYEEYGGVTALQRLQSSTSLKSKNSNLFDTHSQHSQKNAIPVKGNLFKNNNHCDFSLALSKRNIRVSFANLLDKSILIKKDSKQYVTNYTLLTHSTSSSIVWLSILKKFLEPESINSKGTVLIAVPSLDISFTIVGAQLFYKTLIDERALASTYIDIKFKKSGYEFPKMASFDKLLNLVLEQIEKLESSGKLPKDPLADEFVRKLKNDRSFLALTFRKYDRLEWILGENEAIVQILWNILGSAYELELREFQHESHILSDKTMFEPYPIEGFVAKLSNRKAQLKSPLGKQYFKLLYAFSVGNLLFFQEFYNAVPIFPNSEISPRNFLSPAGDVLNLEQLVSASKFNSTTYQYSPYPRSLHHIQWLRPGITLEEYINHDSDALYEAERRSCMISNAHSIVDLCKIKDIRLVPKDEISTALRVASETVWGHINEEAECSNLFKTISEAKKQSENIEYIENCLDLIMDDDSVLRLQMSTRTIRNEWAKNLGKLSEYWTLKKREDLIRHVILKEKNLLLMNTNNDNYESLIANEKEGSCCKWELSKAYTDAQLYSISSYVLERPVIMEGYIYCKKIKSNQFKAFYAVLSPGFFVLYEIFNRSKVTGRARNTAYFKRYAAISLASCYVFASAANSVQAQRTKMFFNSTTGKNGLPRVYGDGWRSSESSDERSFTIWFGSKKIMLSNMKKKRGLKFNEHEKRNLFENRNNDEVESDTDYSSQDENTASTAKKRGSKERSVFSKFKLKTRKTNRNKKGKQFDNEANGSYNDDLNSDSSESINSSSDLDTDTSEDDDEDEEEEEKSFKSEVDSEMLGSFLNMDIADKATSLELLKYISKLGVTGRAIAFLARSRVDRDLWVTRLLNEIERFSGQK